MQSRWSDREATEAVARWGDEHGEALALRLYSARLIGGDDALVLHGGGNVSVKGTHRTPLGEDIPAIHVKASGTDLAKLEPGDLPSLDLAQLARFAELDALSDEAMDGEIRRHRFDAAAPVPSIETLVHAFLPHRFVDHSHADAVLAITNHANGAELAREALGDRVAILPYVRPGFELAKAVDECYRRDTSIEGIVLLHHGLITFGEDARTSYERHVGIVDKCERFLAEAASKRGGGNPGNAARTDSPASSTPSIEGAATQATLAARVAPILRGLIAESTGDEDQPNRRSILEWRGSAALLALIGRDDFAALTSSGPLTGDHLIRTKPNPLLIEKPEWKDADALRSQLVGAVSGYRQQYREYAGPHAGAPGVGDAPRVVLLPGVGLLAWGKTKRDARITADIAERTLFVKKQAAALGAYEALPRDHWHDMEFRPSQRAKLARDSAGPLAGQVVVISGAAGAIGSAIAEECVVAGAHVALTDIDPDRLSRVAERIDGSHGKGRAQCVTMDVTDEASVIAGYEEIVRVFGGVDVIVPNAGIAHVAPIADLAVADFRRVLEINAVGYLLLMREGIKVLKAQGLGGSIVINASKNVFGPGKDFGAYSASKAAGHQLGKVAAIELAPHGIRVNMINADAIFGDEESPSGLWATVGPERAKSRSLSEDDLPEYYRQRNLLKTRVRGRHVGRAVVFFASHATPTTGATLPVDGGVVEAFPR